MLAAVQVVGSLAVAPTSTGPVPSGPATPGRMAADALLLAGPAAFAATRRPVPRAVVATAAAAAYSATGHPIGPVLLTPVLGLALAVLAGRQVQAWLVAVAGLAGALVASRFGDQPLPLLTTLLASGWAVALLASAGMVHGHRAATGVWARAREQARLRAAAEQRASLALDLQDDVIHGVHLITAQASGGLAQLDVDGAEALADVRAALVAIRDLGDDTLAGLRAATAVLTLAGEAGEVGEPVPTAVSPGLDALPELARQWAGTGLIVRGAGDQGPLPPEIDQVAYRVVQEALANVARHSCALNADLALFRDADLLRLVISDPGPPRSAGSSELPRTSVDVVDLSADVVDLSVGPGDLAAMPHEVDLDVGVNGDVDEPVSAWCAPAGSRGLDRIRARVEAVGGALSAGPDGPGWSVHVILQVGPVGPEVGSVGPEVGPVGPEVGPVG